MASNMPLPVPPRTPTPPPDDPPSASVIPSQELGRDTLSPLVESFASPRNPSASEDPDRLSPTKASFNLSVDAAQPNGQSDNVSSGPFNFQTTTMAKSPVVKSVRHAL